MKETHVKGKWIHQKVQDHCIFCMKYFIKVTHCEYILLIIDQESMEGNRDGDMLMECKNMNMNHASVANVSTYQCGLLVTF